MADVRENSLSTYLAEISKIPLLSPAEEIRLARLAKQNDGAARRRLIVSNLRLVISIAKKYLYYGLPLQDLIEEGNLGLMKAVDRYDPERGCKFSTYATWWIRQAVTRSLSNQGRTVRIPVYITDNIARYKKVAEELYIRAGRAPTAQEVAEQMDIKVAEAERLQEFVSAVMPLENLEANDLEGRSIPEALEPPLFDKAIEQFEMDQQMEALMSQLTEREANIVRYRYGLMDGKAHTLEETGKRFKLTRERIRQIEKDVMRRLRGYVAEHVEDFR
ncbi:MAG TPA: RNA polymerase sigma factor RpoD/SigA [Candidatus Hydrogenedentes bacterium]|nr:RNA polymerase sigma factor RpoD/SigA [Candidatus Hydrogenedentota bacterium]